MLRIMKEKLAKHWSNHVKSSVCSIQLDSTLKYFIRAWFSGNMRSIWVGTPWEVRGLTVQLETSWAVSFHDSSQGQSGIYLDSQMLTLSLPKGRAQICLGSQMQKFTLCSTTLWLKTPSVDPRMKPEKEYSTICRIPPQRIKFACPFPGLVPSCL